MKRHLGDLIASKKCKGVVSRFVRLIVTGRRHVQGRQDKFLDYFHKGLVGQVFEDQL